MGSLARPLAIVSTLRNEAVQPRFLLRWKHGWERKQRFCVCARVGFSVYPDRLARVGMLIRQREG